ncbi:MAG: FAD-dependent oxidoreductase [Sphingobacterium sp.]
MNRRKFLEAGALAGMGSLVDLSAGATVRNSQTEDQQSRAGDVLATDVLVAGGSMGGVAAALALLRQGRRVVLTEECDWLGGQMSSQGVPPDEHQWIETHGAPASYRQYRQLVRDYYRNFYPLTDEAKNVSNLNPGNGGVSRICHEPKVSVAVLEQMLAPYVSNGQLTILLAHVPVASKVSGNQVQTVRFKELSSAREFDISACYVVDATELGDLLPLTGTEYVSGTEAQSQTGELHAPERADPQNVQAFTTCFAMDYQEKEDFAQKPDDYAFWSKYIPAIEPAWSGRLLDLQYSNPRTLKPHLLGFDPRAGAETGEALNLWEYRRIIDRNNFTPGFYPSDITLVNWPQNDYLLGSLIDVSKDEFNRHVEASKELGRSLIYWLQTEAPRPDGKKGWRGLRLRNDMMGTADGFAKYPYVRESRRIQAKFTVLEEHVGKDNRKMVEKDPALAGRSARFYDSVGIGYYHIDLHPTQKVNYVDFPSLPFEIPLGALLPIRMENLFPACKNIGTTHLSNGCYRLHPVEWSIGEAVGGLLSYAWDRDIAPAQVREDAAHLQSFQEFLHQQGVEIQWP